MKRIIVIEDGPDTLQFFQLLLEEAGFKVIPYADLITVSQIIALNPSLVLMDYWLPSGFGDQLCRAVKADPFTRHIPVILMSCLPGIGLTAKACLADACIEKPFDIDALLLKVQKLAFGQTYVNNVNTATITQRSSSPL